MKQLIELDVCTQCGASAYARGDFLVCSNGHEERIVELVISHHRETRRERQLEEDREFLRGLARRGAPNPRLINPCDGRGWLYWACIRIAHSDPVRARRIALKMVTGLERGMRWCWDHDIGMWAGGCFETLAGLHTQWFWVQHSGVWLAERGHTLVGELEAKAIWRVTR